MAVSRMSFFASSLVAVIPAALLCYFGATAFMSHSENMHTIIKFGVLPLMLLMAAGVALVPPYFAFVKWPKSPKKGKGVEEGGAPVAAAAAGAAAAGGAAVAEAGEAVEEEAGEVLEAAEESGEDNFGEIEWDEEEK